MTDAAFDRIRDLVANHFEVDPTSVTAETSFVRDLDADSLDMVEVVMVMEEEFRVQIDDEDAERITTVAEARAYLERVKAL